MCAESRDDAQRLALDAVANETGLERSAIVIESIERAEDSSQGCQNVPVSPASEPAPGYRLLLRAAGKLYVVHVAQGQASMCTRGLAVSSDLRQEPTHHREAIPGPADPASRALVSRARDDLARRLSVAPEDVALIAFKAVVWPDGSFGCPRPGMAYIQVPRDGVLIRFQVHGRLYAYHGGSAREPFLCENPDTASSSSPER